MLSYNTLHKIRGFQPLPGLRYCELICKRKAYQTHGSISLYSVTFYITRPLAYCITLPNVGNLELECAILLQCLILSIFANPP